MSWPRPCPNCGSAIPVSPLGELEKRIAELEAELAARNKEYYQALDDIGLWQAEVERLKGLLVSSFIIDGVRPRDAKKLVEILNKDG